MKFCYTLLAITWLTSPIHAQIISTSPVNGSQYHNPQTGIIIRSKEPFAESVALNKHLIHVSGSTSGRHPVELKHIDSNRVLLLQPVTPFDEGETVEVKIDAGLTLESGNKLEAFSITFHIQPHLSPEDKSRIANQMQAIYAEDFGSSTNSKPPQPGKPGLPDLNILTNTTSSAGNIFFSDFNFYLNDEAYYCVINNNGDSVYGKWDTITFNNFDLNRNGYMTAYNKQDSVFMMLDSNYTAIGSFQMGNGYRADVHEFVILPDGTHFMLCYDPQIVDMTVYNPTYNSAATVVGCVLQELDASDNVVFQWRSWDHIPITDADHVNLAGALIDAVHSNAIDIDNDGNILLTSRHLSEVTKINRQTGDIIWRFGGGTGNQFTFVNDPEKISWPHDGRRLENGHLTIFDNGNHHSPPMSHAKEYALDEVNKSATLVWSYTRTIAQGPVFAAAMGDVQRLANGNTFICWGLVNQMPGAPKITEVDSSGSVVWEMMLSDGDAVYRAHRYAWNPCARPSNSFVKVTNITSNSAKISWKPATNASTYEIQYRKSGTSNWSNGTVNNVTAKLKNLLPSTKYEFQIRTKCDDAGSPQSGWTQLKKFKTLPQKTEMTNSSPFSLELFPNPAQDKLSIHFETDLEESMSIRVLDGMGRMIRQDVYQTNSGENTFITDIHQWPSGYYYAEIKGGNLSEVKGFVKE